MTYGSQTILILDPSIYNMYAEIQGGVDATRATLRIPKLSKKWQKLCLGFKARFLPIQGRAFLMLVESKFNPPSCNIVVHILHILLKTCQSYCPNNWFLTKRNSEVVWKIASKLVGTSLENEYSVSNCVSRKF